MLSDYKLEVLFKYEHIFQSVKQAKSSLLSLADVVQI